MVFVACPLIANGSTVLYSTMGPNGQFDGTYAWLLGGYGSETMADAFIPYTTSKLADAVLVLQYNSYYTNNSPVQVFLEADAGQTPGPILDSLTQVGTLQTLPGPITFTCTSCPMLQAGTTYWLVAVQPDVNSVDGWKYSYGDQLGLSAVNFLDSQTGPWITLTTTVSAFRIDGTVPEPSTLMLAAGSLMAGLRALRRRRSIG
jgi:hypothetical protein